MYSKETENLKLPQWEPKDHPDFLTDINNAFKKIDNFAGDMEFINEPIFNDVVAKQNQLAADMRKVQDDIKILDTEEHELEKRVTIAEDRIQHEHETNDTQDTQIKNLQADLHNEMIQRAKDDASLHEKIEAETNRAQETEKLIQENVNIEVQRATAVENALQTAIEGLNSSTNELETEVVSLRNYTMEINSRLSIVENTVEGDSFRLDDVVKQVQALDDSTSELETTLRSDIEKLQEGGESYANEINDLKEANTVQHTEINQLEEHLQLLEEKHRYLELEYPNVNYQIYNSTGSPVGYGNADEVKISVYGAHSLYLHLRLATTPLSKKCRTAFIISTVNNGYRIADIINVPSIITDNTLLNYTLYKTYLEILDNDKIKVNVANISDVDGIQECVLMIPLFANIIKEV